MRLESRYNTSIKKLNTRWTNINQNINQYIKYEEMEDVWKINIRYQVM